MNFIGALLNFCVGYWLDVNIADVPFAQLTLKMVFSSIFSLVCYVWAIFLLGKSLFIDMLWPWHWRWNRYFLGNLACKVVIGFCGAWLAVYFTEGRAFWLQLSLLAFVGLSIIGLFFTDEFDPFTEKNLIEASPENTRLNAKPND